MDNRNSKGQFLGGKFHHDVSGSKNPKWKDGLWARNPKEYSNNYVKEAHQKKRLIVIRFYGGNPPKCKCCSEQEYKFLSIDHIVGGRGKQKIGGEKSGYTLYGWLIKNNFPKGFQVLCHNCNMAKGLYGRCPHEPD